MHMESILLLEDGARDTCLQHLMHSLRGTYICLWRFFPSTNCLISMAGYYNDENTHLAAASTSAGTTLGRRLFDDYRHSVISINNDHVPGLAFQNGNPFMELEEADLHRLASSQAQLQFYQEAKIKTAIFMGCKAGEIELGLSFHQPRVNLEMEMKNLFAEDFWQQIPLPLDQTLHPSSSSSLLSLSMDSSEGSPLLFTTSNTSSVSDIPRAHIFEPAFGPVSSAPPISPLHQAIMQPFSTQMGSRPQLIPSLAQTEHDVMAKAILAVLSASSPSSTPQNVVVNNPLNQRDSVSAFKRYSPGSSSGPDLGPLLGARGGVNVKRQNMVKKSIRFLTALDLMRRRERLEQTQGGSRPNRPQQQHMISERKRREKLKESFEALGSLLPPGTKKNKATVLRSATEYLTSLKSQVAELTKKIQILETQISSKKESRDNQMVSIPSNEVLHVQIMNSPESTSRARVVDLRVFVRGEINHWDIVIHVLEFLKEVKNVEVMSIEADTRAVESAPVYCVVMRLKIEGGEWDESAFQEAVRRVLADLAQ